MNTEQTTKNAFPETKPVLAASFSHRQLCKKAASYLKNVVLYSWHRCQYVVCELERSCESPDAFGFGRSTQLIEVKVSRGDFLSDKKKIWRQFPENGLGNYRSYLCPEGLIKISDLPAFWGLLWIDSEKKITVIKKAEYQESDKASEIAVAMSIMRREGVMPKIFSYKKYTNDKHVFI